MSIAGEAPHALADTLSVLRRSLNIDALNPGPLATNQEPLKEGAPEDRSLLRGGALINAVSIKISMY